MSHSGPFRCQCGQIHADIYDGPSNDLLPYIDLDACAALNAVGGMEAARRIFKPFDERLNREAWLESEEDDPQVLIHIVFTAPVKIRALTLIGGSEGDAPRELRAFVNQEAMDFADAEDTAPVQQWDLQPDGDPLGVIEYPTQFSRFQNVTRLSLLVADNHGADVTRIFYLGLKGVGTEHKRRAVAAVYELKPLPEANANQVGAHAQVE